MFSPITYRLIILSLDKNLVSVTRYQYRKSRCLALSLHSCEHHRFFAHYPLYRIIYPFASHTRQLLNLRAIRVRVLVSGISPWHAAFLTIGAYSCYLTLVYSLPMVKVVERFLIGVVSYEFLLVFFRSLCHLHPLC